MPSFAYRDRPFAAMAAFKAHASFGFWDRHPLATGQEGDGMGQYGRLDDVSKLPSDAELDPKIRQAMALIESGERPRRAARPPKPEAEVPPALAVALVADPAAQAIFHDTFAPSHRREYCEWVAEAKRDQTRDKRVAQAVEWIREGKQRNWKYQNC